jgi:Holliday junction resolvase-like predicted endonuclease
MRTAAQRAGDAAEELVRRRLAAAGWTILAGNVRCGRLELDVLAIDPGPPARLVAVEVRWRRRRDFGLPEETIDRRKLGHLRVALGRIVGVGRLPDGTRLPRLPPAIDIVSVEPGPGGGSIRHFRDVTS